MAYQDLISILQQNADPSYNGSEERPAACPNDGRPLKQGPDGLLFCPDGDWDESFGGRGIDARSK